MIPKTGVYLVSVPRQGRLIPGVMNIGLRPTFRDSDPKLTLEVHLLGVEENLYGGTLRVQFHRFLREERRFGSVDDLICQIREDVRRAEAEWPEERPVFGSDEDAREFVEKVDDDRRLRLAPALGLCYNGSRWRA